MIDHKKKLIFIHAQRSAGTSVEIALVGRDWCGIDLQTKHITATESRKRYGETIWNDYTKFSIIRNPWDRVISMWATKWYHKDIKKTNNDIKQFLLQLEPASHEHGLQCSDYINEPLDTIIRFENLSTEFAHFIKQFECNHITLPHKSKKKRNNYKTYYNKETKQMVAEMFKDDIRLFNYEF